MSSKQLEPIARKGLSETIIAFLKESNAYFKILNIDYSLPSLQKKEEGYFGAFSESQQRAFNHLPISISDLSRWQAMIVKEQLQFGSSISKHAMGKIRSDDMPINITIENYQPPDYSQVPALLETLIDDLNQRLQQTKDHVEETDVVFTAALLGDMLQKFEEIHPFVEANGRLGQLIANYIVSWFGFPILIFRVSEKAEFYAAHKSALAMRIFMAKKMQEAVFSEEGEILTLCKHYGLSASYSCPSNPKVEKLTVEWHALLKAIDLWQKELSLK